MKLVLAMVAVVLAALAVAMAFAHGVRTRPIMADNQLYFFMTERCASGVPPHVSQLEVKTQLPTLIGGAAIAAGRRLGISDVMAARAASVTASAVAAVLAWLLVLELTGSVAASIAGGAATFAILGLFMEAATGFQPKVFMVAFMLAAHWCCAVRRPFGAGLAGVAAFLCWQPAALVGVACGIATVAERRDSLRATARAVLRMLAGGLVAFGAYEAWFAMNGALAAQIRQEWVLASGAPHKAIDWAESIWFVLTEARGFEGRVRPMPVVFAVSLAALWLGSLARPRRALGVVRQSPGLTAFWIAAHLALAFTLYDHQAHPDMLLVQPYFVVASGVLVGWIVRALERLPAGRTLGVVAAASFVVWMGFLAHRNVVRTGGAVVGLEKQYALARLASLYPDHRGSVWALGSVHLLAFNRLDNWIPIGNVGHETQEFDLRTFRPEKRGVMPEIIIAGRGFRPGAGKWLGTEYLDITPAAFAVDRLRVYSRRIGPGSGFEKDTAPKPAPLPQKRPAPPKADKDRRALRR